MDERLEQIRSDALRDLEAAGDPAALEKWRIAYLGSKGRLKGAMELIRDVPPEGRPAFGAALNQVKEDLESALASRRERPSAAGDPADAARAAGPMIDVTEPGLLRAEALGRRHIIMRVHDELVEVFARLGFAVAQGPELEDEEHNFVKLNIPADHPAREPSDNFFVDDPSRVSAPRMLRSQTSTVQVRVMETQEPPIRVVAPGRVYRPDTVDATHSFMFHQLEGLHIDRGVSLADLKATLFQFARAYFGPEAEVRLRPSYFPFTEPSAEFDLRIALRPGQPPRWMELGGCGMVDPAVLVACGIDPETWTGYAFGFGIERLAMGKYGIPDIRMLFENDLRFLSQV
ncbi:MAG TPA: phenylalanine--tRNA ligase subunit alpha [Phycisphaerales bacterium]|nr:phenylalanine--tRNA ligase subunit alpha [Phycisphaerales bacterium]